MTDHARLIAASISVRPPVRGDVGLMIASAERAAVATDAALPIATAIVMALRSANILLPMPSTIERARKNAAHMMVADLSTVNLDRIDALFTEQDGALLGWLKTVPVATKTDSVREIVERLSIVRSIGIPQNAGVGVHLNRRHQFVQEGRLSPAYLIQRYTVARRRAIIVALLIDLEAQLINAALDIADKLIGSMFRRATTMQQRRYTASSREVARLMRLLHITIDTLAQADEDGSDPIAALEAVGSRGRTVRRKSLNIAVEGYSN